MTGDNDNRQKHVTSVNETNNYLITVKLYNINYYYYFISLNLISGKCQ